MKGDTVVNQEKKPEPLPSTGMPWQKQTSNPGDSSPAPTGGPQFGMENKGGWGKRSRGWIVKYGSSIILPIIALAILAGGIYLYASQKSEETNIFEETNQEGIIDFEELNIDQESENTFKDEETVIEEIIPEGRKEGGVIVETAVRGDGITHLARRALKDYLTDQPQELTNEHKIYVEDYLKDNIGSQPLEVGEEISFSEDLIKEAINASMELDPEQLKNLEKYSALVVSW